MNAALSAARSVPHPKRSQAVHALTLLVLLAASLFAVLPASAQTTPRIERPLLKPQRPAVATPAARRPLPVPSHASTLKVCTLSCYGDTASMGESLSFPLPHQRRSFEFRWYSEASNARWLLWQVSERPFGSNAIEVAGLSASGMVGVDGARSGDFSIDFGQIYNRPPAAAATARPRASTTTQLQSAATPQLRRVPAATLSAAAAQTLRPRQFHIRFFPIGEHGALGPPSNPVQLGFAGSGPELQPVVYPHLYSVSLLRFEDIKPATLSWGCVYIRAVNAPAGTANPMADLYKGFLQSGQPLCPKSYRGIGEPPWYEQLWDAMLESVSWPAQKFEWLKSGVVNLVADGINGALGVDICNDWCRGRLMNALEAGLVALGVPPELPDAQQLLSNGREYLVTSIAEQAGLEDCEPCKQKIGEGLDWVADELKGHQLGTICAAEEAHRHGREPLCLPAWVKAEPAPESHTRPARLLLRVTRNAGVSDLGPSSLDHYRLHLGFEAQTGGFGDSLMLNTMTCERDGYESACELERFPIPGKLSGALFEPIGLAVPRLAPGQHIDIPLALSPASYWVPGHLERIRQKGGRLRYDDWYKLYRGAELSIRAEIDCPGITFGNNCRDSATMRKTGLGQ
jgi:hypothetical protein